MTLKRKMILDEGDEYQTVFPEFPPGELRSPSASSPEAKKQALDVSVENSPSSGSYEQDTRECDHKMLLDVEGDMTSSVPGKKGQMEKDLNENLQTLTDKLEHVFKAQQEQRQERHAHYSRMLESFFNQWQDNMQKAKEQEEAFNAIYRQQLRILLQGVNAQQAKFEKVKSLFESFLKRVQARDENALPGEQGEVQKDMAMLQENLLMEHVSGSTVAYSFVLSQALDNVPEPQKRRRHVDKERSRSQSETQDIECTELHIEEAVPPPCTHVSSCYPVMNTSSGEIAGVRTSSPPYRPRRASSSRGMIYTRCRKSAKASQNQSGEGPIKAQAMLCIDPLPTSEMAVKIDELVRYLLYKYARKEPVTEAQMLSRVIGKYQGYSHVIFSHASECLLLVFGIEMQEIVPCGHTYVTVAALDLTYDGMLSELPGIPKTGLLILVLSIIFMEYYHAREEVVWGVLNDIGVFADRDHFMYGRPRKLITEDFVREGYLKYQQVPYAFPVCYEFLWGTRACAEISGMKILEFLYKIIESDRRLQPMMQYGEALRDEEERAKASIASAEDGPVMRSASPSALAASSEDKGQAVISVVEGEAVAAGTTV